MFKTIYHIKDGAKEFYEIDARHAVASFPDEWSDKPWPEMSAEDKKQAKAEKDRRDREAAERAEAERLAREQAEKDQAERDRLEAERIAREQREADEAKIKAELEGMSNSQLVKLAQSESISVESDDNKASLVSKIIEGRKAK